ncbi:MAG: hypothetical protein MHM6MM_000476 [Cercozoa sp. M6MM]
MTTTGGLNVLVATSFQLHQLHVDDERISLLLSSRMCSNGYMRELQGTFHKQQLVTASSNGSVCVYDTRLASVHRFSSALQSPVEGTKYLRTHLAVQFQLASNCSSENDDGGTPPAFPTTIKTHPHAEKDLVMAGYSDGVVRVFDLQTSSMIFETRMHRTAVAQICVHPNGKTFTTVGTVTDDEDCGIIAVYECASDHVKS